MFKTVTSGLAVAAAIVLSGCAGIPKLDIQSPVTVADIIDRIQCEAYKATLHNPKLRNDRWAGAADLYLTVDDNAGDLPLKFHPVAIGVSADVTPAGAV